MALAPITAAAGQDARTVSVVGSRQFFPLFHAPPVCSGYTSCVLQEFHHIPGSTVTEKGKMATQGISSSMRAGETDSFLAVCISPDADSATSLLLLLGRRSHLFHGWRRQIICRSLAFVVTKTPTTCALKELGKSIHHSETVLSSALRLYI